MRRIFTTTVITITIFLTTMCGGLTPAFTEGGTMDQPTYLPMRYHIHDSEVRALPFAVLDMCRLNLHSITVEGNSVTIVYGEPDEPEAQTAQT